MKLSHIITGFVAASAGYIIYTHGLWEPLRTIVVGTLCGTVALAAFLRHRNRSDRADTGYQQIAFASIALGVGSLGLGIDRLIGSSVASALGPVLFTTAAGCAGIAVALAAPSRPTARVNSRVENQRLGQERE